MKKLILSFATVLSMGILTILVSSYKSSAPDKDTVRLQIGGTTLWANMDGEQEVAAGDADGTGWVELTLNYGQGTIEYTLTVQNIDPATAAHIHIGPPGVAGPVVVPLAAPTDGSSSGIVEVDREIIKAIRKDPSAFYVNVHNVPYPGGAVRGQLSK